MEILSLFSSISPYLSPSLYPPSLSDHTSPALFLYHCSISTRFSLPRHSLAPTPASRHHSFHYNVRYALIDLDRSPHPQPHHLSADEARQITDTTAPGLLLTIPPRVGYEQNPLSLYYSYDVEGSSRRLKNCIAEVTNTPWGERASFVFNPEYDLVAKALHVSPFMALKLVEKCAV